MPSTGQRDSTWVWKCTDQSIAAGQISVLALAEAFAAVGLYWLLATHFDWFSLSVIGLIAAPMLLLRSPESVHLGVRMLKRYVERNEIPPWESVLTVILTAAVTILLSYGIAERLRSLYADIAPLLFIGGYIAGFVVLIPVAGAVLIAGVGSNSSPGWAVTLAGPSGGPVAIDKGTFLISMMGSLMVSSMIVAGLAGEAAGIGVAVGGFLAIFLAMHVFVVKSESEMFERQRFRNFIALLMVVMGLILRGVVIRWFATCRHLPLGLARLPHNWRETLAVIDLTHSPELIPQAGHVSESFFTVSGIWAMLKNAKPYQRLWWGFLLTALYLTALAYRWSLKASAWLWWPLALALEPPLERLNEQVSRERTSITVGGLWRWLPYLAAGAVTWLALSAWPSLVTKLPEALPNMVKAVAKQLLSWAPPPLGIRYVFICLSCALALWLWYRSANLKAAFDKVLGSPKELRDLDKDERTRFMVLARHVERVRLLFIVALVALVEAYALSIAHDRAPLLVERFVAPWVFQWL